MTNIKLLEKLFSAHHHDLQIVAPERGVVFLCPICLRDFEISAIYDRVLTEGHVLPNHIREETNSGIASSQRVLLCDLCNHTAGSRGDAQMQILHQVREAEDTGRLYGERRVQLLFHGERPTELRASIVSTGEKSAKLVFDADSRTGQWLRNNPAAQARFKQLGPEDRFSMLIHPPHNLKTHLAQSGWITSAFLYAFYSFGYRYALSSLLDPVREYILASFDESAKEQLPAPRAVDFRVDICSTHYYDDPVLELMVPLDGETPIHLQISFLDYHVRLPFPCNPDVLLTLLQLEIPGIEDRLNELSEQGGFLSAKIECTKTAIHECVWDYVLGKEIPSSRT